MKINVTCGHFDRTLTRALFTQAVAIASAIVLVFLFSAPMLHGQGQAALASLSGTVLDSSGAVIPGAVVVLSNKEKAFSRELTAESNGRYTFSLVPPGTYVLQVTHPGFQTYSQPGVLLTLGQIASQDVTLTVGEVSQTVSVSGTTVALNTADATVATDLGEEQITQIPLDFRSPYFLVSLNSGTSRGAVWQTFNGGGMTSGPGADQDAGAFVMNGSRYGTVGFLLDGHWNGSADWDAIMYGPTVDETQEMKIQQNVFTTQYGLSMGQVINVITKSGTSELHGGIFEFIRNNDLDANNWFNDRAGIPLPHFERNQFGGTIGGPIYIPHIFNRKDKLFFFGSYEGLRQGSPLTETVTVPTSDFIKGNFSALLGAQSGNDALGRPIYQGAIYNPLTTRAITAGDVDPSTGLTATASGYIRDPIEGNIITSTMMDPVAKAAAAYFPPATGAGTSSNFTASVSTPTSQDKYTVRVDDTISDKSSFFTRWSQTFEFKGRTGAFYGPNDPAGQGEKAPNNRYDVGAGVTHTFSPTFVMSVNAGMNRWVEGRVEQGYGFSASKLGLPTFFDEITNQFPNFSMDGTAPLGTSTAQAEYIRQTWSGGVDFTKVIGAHTLSFGYMNIEFIGNGRSGDQSYFNFPQSMTEGPDPTVGNPRTGWGFASFLLGTGNSGGLPQNASGAFIKKYNGGYLQDQWQLSRRLTATVGLRYEIQAAPTERHNRMSYFDFTDTNPIQAQLATGANIATPGYLVYNSSSNRGLYDPQYDSFAPRVSLSYKVTDKMVVRAGYGIFDLPNYVFSLPFQGYSETTPFVGTVDGITPNNLVKNPFPGGLIAPPGNSLGPLTNVGLGVSAVNRKRPISYVNNWMFGVQYAFTAKDKVDASYVGNHGVQLDYSSYESNQLNPAKVQLGDQLLTPVTNPFYGLISSSSCGLDQPTVPAGQLLRPFPQYCSVASLLPLGGSSWYDGATIEYTHQFNHNVYLLASYTVSKFLDNTEGDADWTSGANSGIRNVYNLAAEKALDPNDIPQSFVVSYIAQLPFGKGQKYGRNMHRAPNAVLGGWQFSGVGSYKKGMPLGITTSTNNAGVLGNSQRPNLVGNPNAVPAGVDRHNEWFNTAAFAQPPAYTFGNIGRSLPSTRGPGLSNWDLGLQKYFSLTERVRMQFRAEFYDAFNHPNFYNPDTNLGDGAFGQLNSVFPGRDIQFALKLDF